MQSHLFYSTSFDGIKKPINFNLSHPKGLPMRLVYRVPDMSAWNDAVQKHREPSSC